MFKILAIDDEKANLKILSSLLKEDYTLMLAKSGKQGVELASKSQPDLILLDIIMPEMDGFEVLKHLQGIESCKDIPVIFITGLSAADKEEEGLALGACDYIHKPFYPPIVKARIYTHVKLIEQNKKLQTLSAELELANKSKGRFLANMSHEIRTPLTSIIGYTDSILRHEIPKSQQEEALKRVSSNGQHLLGLINDILDFSKIEENQLCFEHIECHLHTLIKETLAIVEDAAKRQGVALNTTYKTDLPNCFLTDPLRLKQILLNLLSNAIKFSKHNEQDFRKGLVVELVVGASDDRRTLSFAVSDCGIGMNDKTISNLFTPFEQANTSTTREYGGTGLGLSISKYLAENMGGDIEVDSTLGKGSCFTASIACEENDNTQWCSYNKDQDEDAGPKHAQMKSLSGHVLLADDHKQNRELIALLLVHLGLDVSQAENGQQAVELALEEDIDLIFLDIQMPVMDGVSAMKMIREMVGSELPIVALTANALKQDVDSYLSIGFDEHCSKPIDRSHFFALVNKYLGDLEKVDDIEIDKEKLAELHRDFKLSLLDDKIKITQSIENNDTQKLALLAHKIKGCAGSFGEVKLAAISDDIERFAKSDNREEYLKLIPQLMLEIEKQC